MRGVCAGYYRIVRSLVGSTLGRFRVDRWLGKGGMGAVYAAFDERLEREVALKVLLEDDGSPAQKRRFLREARLAAQVTHPNIATVYEVDEIDGRVTIVMELLEGTSLRRVLANRRLEPDEALSFARDIARALARAHKSGIVHRDIKPENVFITEPAPGAFLAKVLDFGLARQGKKDPAAIAGVSPLVGEITDTTTTAHIWGTPGYMSPEQAEGENIDARSDVFSFGSVLYEMLAGIRPFRAENNVALLLAIARKEPKPIRDIVPTLVPDLEHILHRCMKKAKEERFADGVELSNAIEKLFRGAPTSSSPNLRESSPGFISSSSLVSAPSLPAVPSPEPSRPSQPGKSQPTPYSSAHDTDSRRTAAPFFASIGARLSRTTKNQRIAGAAGALAFVFLLAIIALVRSSTNPAEAGAVAAIGDDVPPPPPTTVVAPPPPPPAPTAVEEPEPVQTADIELPASSAPPPPVVHKPRPHGSAPKGKPADCAQPFIIDSKGVKIPKMHCL